jgi:hypothetical protein
VADLPPYRDRYITYPKLVPTEIKEGMRNKCIIAMIAFLSWPGTIWITAEIHLELKFFIYSHDVNDGSVPRAFLLVFAASSNDPISFFRQLDYIFLLDISFFVLAINQRTDFAFWIWSHPGIMLNNIGKEFHEINNPFALNALFRK